MAPQTAAKMTYEDLLLLPDDGKRHEIIDGEHYVSPAPKLIHQIILQRLAFAFSQHLEAHGGGVVLFAPVDVVFSNDSVVEPDLLLVTDARRVVASAKNVQGAPDLALEILSESNRRYDEITKRDLYLRHNVTEYWIVDPELRLVKIYRGGAKSEISEGAVTTPLLPNFSLELAWLFRE